MNSENDKIAIDVKHVSKTFIATFGAHSFKESFVNISKKILGKNEQKVESTDYTALKDINFSIKQGEFFGVVGRNGGGKSTLLKIIAGVYTPTTGEVAVSGKLTPFIELGVGFNPELTGHDNVYLNGALLGFTRKQMDAMYDDIVEFAELEEFMSMKLKNYSSGMQVRLAFSVAIRAKTEILVVDEVLAVGDAAFQRKCFDYFMNLKKEHQTVVLVTHDMGAIRQYCDRAVLIEDGRIAIAGSAEEVAQAYQQMFSDEEDSQRIRKGEGGATRWGNQKMLAAKPKLTINEDTIEIITEYEAKTFLESVVIGFSIYGPNGENILESNTKVLKHKIGALKNGQKIAYKWSIPNILAEGQYELSVACCDESTTEFYDWVNKASVFRIKKEYATTGVVNPKITLIENGEVPKSV